MKLLVLICVIFEAAQAATVVSIPETEKPETVAVDSGKKEGNLEI